MVTVISSLLSHSFSYDSFRVVNYALKIQLNLTQKRTVKCSVSCKVSITMEAGRGGMVWLW
jgi:hypothetical protein